MNKTTMKTPILRIVIMWFAATALAAGALIAWNNTRTAPEPPARMLENIDRLNHNTATTISLTRSGTGPSSTLTAQLTSDSSCLNNRSVSFFRDSPGSVPDVQVGTATTNSNGTASTTVLNDGGTYYAVVAASTHCAGNTSNTVTVPTGA